MTAATYWATVLLLCLCGWATSQPCLYNYTIGNGSPVVINQTAPVCLICSNTAYTSWAITGSAPVSGISGALYILYVPSPTTTFFGGPTVGCASGPGSSVSSTVVVAAPVVPQVVTYVNETDTLNLMCTSVITVSGSIIPLFGSQSWLDPYGNTISTSRSASVPSINRTAAGNYTCVTPLATNANGISSITASTLVVVNYLNITSPQPSVFMPQGLSVQLNCSFNGLPVPTITWTLPSGSVLTSSQGRFMLQSTSTFTSLTISSLVGGGDSGTYTCTASNLRGVASSSVQLTVQVPPDGPSSLAVTSTDNSSISLNWTNGFNGYSSLSAVVISYEVDRYPQDGTRSQTFPMGTSATLTGLHPYSNYTIHVRLTNAVGLVSNPSNITNTTASLRPTAPSITSVVANNSTQLTIMWMAPPISSSTTAPLTSWTISYTCSSSWNPSCPSGTITSIPPPSSSYSISGLVKGSSYTFVVGGVNSGGVGDLSPPATNQTAVDPPMAVIGLLATVMTTTSVNLTWSPPGDNGGEMIANYIIQYGIAGTSNVTMTTTTATQILLSGLAQNSWYQFNVTANNGLYNGVLSSTVVLLIGYPIMPAVVWSSLVADTYVNISWQLQTPAGFIDNFIVSYRTISSQTWTMATSSLLNYTRSYLLTGLTPNTTYVVGVATKNAIKNPPNSNYTTTTFTTAVPPDAPSNLAVASTDSSSISLCWTNGFNGYSNLSAVVISYEVDRYPQDGTRSQTFPMGTSATLTGLHPYSNYIIHVMLTNAVGLVSNPSNITNTTASLRPTAPSITSVVANNSTQLTIMWMVPPINSSTTAPLTSWTISYTCSSSWNPSCPSGTITSIPPSSSSSYSISGLVKGSSYTFVVGGVNSGGVGDLSPPATNQTAVDPPTAVIGLLATVVTTTSVNLTWSPPGDNGGEMIANYIIQYGIAGTSNVTMTTTTATQILLSGLAQNSWYQFNVTANNGLYNGVLSSTSVLLIGYPIMPAVVWSSLVADTYVNISWQLQTPAGFIDSFIVSYRTISSQTWTMATSSLLNYTRSYLLTGLTPNTTYVVGVATKNPLPVPSNYTTTTFTTAGPSTGTSTATVVASIGTAVGVSVSVTFVVSFSLGVLVASVLCYISRRSKESYKPHADPATVYDAAGTNKKMKGDIMEMDANTAYGLVSARPLQ